VSGHAKMPLASNQVSATSLKLLIQQIHPHVCVERDSGMCVARDLYELWGFSGSRYGLRSQNFASERPSTLTLTSSWRINDVKNIEVEDEDRLLYNI
jgi:hypothetical protein